MNYLLLSCHGDRHCRISARRSGSSSVALRQDRSVRRARPESCGTDSSGTSSLGTSHASSKDETVDGDSLVAEVTPQVGSVVRADQFFRHFDPPLAYPDLQRLAGGADIFVINGMTVRVITAGA